jgi:hypothetical protein
MHIDKWMAKMDSEQTVPGFTTSVKTRPLVISQMEAYIRDRAFIFRSKRLLEELRVFIWHNGKASAQTGYNDDLVMALGIGLFTRDTGVKFAQQGMDLTRLSIDNMSNNRNPAMLPPMLPNGAQTPYIAETPYGFEDFRWVL